MTFDLPATEAGVYVASGEVRVGSTHVAEGQLVLLGEGQFIEIASDEAADVFVLGGPPLDAPIRRYGPFVMNTEAELAQAVRDFQAGKFGTIPHPAGHTPSLARKAGAVR
jgi:redox-sensitive bicupin YhaK (pirin superfamily)